MTDSKQRCVNESPLCATTLTVNFGLPDRGSDIFGESREQPELNLTRKGSAVGVSDFRQVGVQGRIKIDLFTITHGWRASTLDAMVSALMSASTVQWPVLLHG